MGNMMEMAGKTKGAISNRGMDAFGPTKSLDDELRARGFYDPRISTEMKRNRLDLLKAMDKLANPEISMAPFGSIDTSADVQAILGS